MANRPSTDGSNPYISNLAISSSGSVTGSDHDCSALASSSDKYELDLDKAVELILRRGAKLVGLQAPEGLKRSAPEIAREIARKTGARVVISGDPCYGACDLDLALSDEVDILLHLGHADLGEPIDKIVFLEARMNCDLKKAVESAIPLLSKKKVGVATTVQHVHNLDQAVAALREDGIEGVIGPACPRTKYPGQVLGCCYSAAKALNVEEYLFIGTGQFHPLGIAMSTGKRIIAADPITFESRIVDPSPFLRRRFGGIARAMDAERIAILVSKKPGQKRWNLAIELMEMGEAAGKKMSMVFLDNVEPDRLLNLGVDAAVSTACPRIAYDDAAKYKIPILTPPEFEVLLGIKDWEECSFDEIDQA